MISPEICDLATAKVASGRVAGNSKATVMEATSMDTPATPGWTWFKTTKHGLKSVENHGYGNIWDKHMDKYGKLWRFPKSWGHPKLAGWFIENGKSRLKYG
jgi:hypothetical protein